MVRAVEQIEQEIAALDQTVAAIAQAFYDAYQQYLTALGQATRQQLILAGYHICTHGYPEQFLNLSLQQRQDLQQSLQRLAKQGQTRLSECLTPVTPQGPVASSPLPVQLGVRIALRLETEQDEDPLALEEFQPQPEEAPADDFAASPTMAAATDPSEAVEAFSVSPLEGLESSDELNPELSPELSSNLSLEQTEDPSSASILAIQPDVQANAQANAQSEPAAVPVPNERSLQPSDVARWQSRLEEQITETLQNLSHRANRALQQANVLPNRLPEPVLEVAAQADLSSESVSPPNLLNLLIESDEEEGKSSMTQIIAIRLRLSEIEFGDATAAAHRSKLRHLITQLAKLGREYQRKQKECAVARAEAAWRSSWFEGENGA